MQTPKADPKTLGAKLRKLRQRRDMSLDQVAALMRDNYGLNRTRQNLHQHEQGLRVPSSVAVGGYCRVYNLNTEESQELFTLAGYVVVFAVEEA